MPIILSILLLVCSACFGGWELRENPKDPNAVWWDFVPDVIRPIEKPKRQWIACDDGILNDLERCLIYQFHWHKGGCLLSVRENGSATRIAANKWHSKGTVKQLDYCQAKSEIFDGWLQDGRNYNLFDFLEMARNWPGHTVIEPNEPVIPEVIIDPAAMAILEKYMDTAKTETIAIILAALADGDDLMLPVTVYKYQLGWYHRSVCIHLPKGRNAVGALSTIPLIEAVLQGKRPCTQCKPPVVGDK